LGSFKTSREHTMITLCSFELVYEDIFAIIAVDVPRHPHMFLDRTIRAETNANGKDERWHAEKR